jgi:hypothetical protein
MEKMEKMKILKYISFSFFAWIFLLSGCEEMKIGNAALEQPPTVSVTLDTVFSKLEYAERVLFDGYRTLPWGLEDRLGGDLMESITDLCHSYLLGGGANTFYYSGSLTAYSENYHWETKFGYIHEQTWQGIRKAWIFIDNADKIPDVTPKYLRRLKAEARIIIALHYTDMFRNFGALPWIDHTYAPDDPEVFPRLTLKQTLDSIIHQIDLAVPDLPWVVEERWDGRFTKAAALGLKVRLLLFAASPLFNDDVPYMDGEASQLHQTWFGYKDPALWQEAADAAIDLINEVESNGYYHLVNTGNPRQDFQDGYYKRGNGEVLISTRRHFRSWDGWVFYVNAGDKGAGCITQEYVDMFGMANGLPITDPNSGYDPDDPFINRDPRLYETVLVDGDYYQGRTAELWIGGRERPNIAYEGTRTGYGLRKFLLERNNATSIGSIIHWPYLRLAEIYLSAAEALNEVNGGPTAEAYRYANAVRERVGLPGLQENLSLEDFREAVIEERAKEFGFEEVRWYDLARWKRADIFQKILHGEDLYKNADGTYIRQRKELPLREWRVNWTPKWYLSAFPPDELYKEYGLTQNPGWEK